MSDDWAGKCGPWPVAVVGVGSILEVAVRLVC